MRDHVFLERALVEEGVISSEQLEAARQFSSENHVDITDALVRTEAVTGRAIAMVNANVCEVPYVDLQDYEPNFGNTQYVPRSVAERYQVYPLFMIEGVLTLAMVDPLNLEGADQVRQVARCEVDPMQCEREQLRALIARAYSLSHAAAPELSAEDRDTIVEEVSGPVVSAVNQIISDAIESRASDIHINPDEHDLHLRVRVDGVLQAKQGPPLSMHPSLVQRLKVMAHLDLTQTRRPQDGKFRFAHATGDVDVRMSSVPTVCGENVVLRLLANAQSFHDFHDLGVPAKISTEIEHLLHQPYGMVLVTGPTGSGKTTTLYTALNKINDPALNLITVEDPVEIRLPYVRQIQVHHEIGLTFANALRSILRQDPDVVLVGEIRDDETATIALQAALTGHMVLSTLHTNDAVGAVSRLRDYGLPPFVINSALLGVLAQRLVRRVCTKCQAPSPVNDLMRERFGLGDDVDGFIWGRGCGRCGQTGYRGRVGIYEMLTMCHDVKHLIEEGASMDAIRDAAIRNGMQLMWQDGLTKARLKHTTLEEIAKVASIIQIGDADSDSDAEDEEERGRMSAISFHYKAINREGGAVKGVIEAADKGDAYRQLVSSGVRPIRIAASRRLGGKRRKKVSLRDLSHFTRQFTVLMQAAIPVVEGLQSLAEQEPNPTMREVIEEVATQIEAGSNITEAMLPHERLFGPVYIETIRAAETSGNMVEVLGRLADILDNQYQTTKMVKAALMYPVCVVVALIAAMSFLMIFVVPRFAEMFASRNVPLPLPTQVVVGISDVVRTYWYAIGGGVVGLVLLGRRLWAEPTSRRRIDTMLHRVPVLRPMLTGLAVSRFTHILAITLRSGLNLIDALDMSGKASGRPLLQADAEMMRNEVELGAGLPDVLSNCSYLPPFARRMLKTGGESGSLSSLCEIVARHYDREVGYLTKTVTTALEPILIAGLAGVVLLIALAIFLPMWNMATLIG